jgi:N-acetylmuramoyl-L-alanine amidase
MSQARTGCTPCGRRRSPRLDQQRHPPLIGMLLSCVMLALGCHAGPVQVTPLPQPAPRVGPLAITIAYPREGSREETDSGLVIAADTTVVLRSQDSLFILGSVGRGDATLTINGWPVPVYATGGWIAWLPVPQGASEDHGGAWRPVRFALVATAGADTVRATLLVTVRRGFESPPAGVWIDTTSFAPVGAMWVQPDEPVRLSVRAAPGASVALVLPGGRRVPLLDDHGFRAAPEGQEAFGTQAPGAIQPIRSSRYVASWVGSLGPDPGEIFAPHPAPPAADTAWPNLEVVVGSDTAWARWPLRVGVLDATSPRVIYVDDDTARTGLTDGELAGRAAPYATYNWFFPNGTLAAVSGRWNDQIRLRLSNTSVAWVDAADVHALPAGTPPPGGRTGGSVRLFHSAESVTLRVPLPAHVPFRVDEADRGLRLVLYGVQADMDFMQYGAPDSMVRRMWFEQPTQDQAVISLQLREAVWGYRARWAGNDLMLDIRRPPLVDPVHPLHGRKIAVDPGHPPLGAVGPTGVHEADVTLAVGRKVEQLLQAAGATVVMLRSDDRPIDLAARVAHAERADAELLVSIHANALPDGVNPFVNNGTSVYYFQPRSVDLARALDAALVRQFGFHNLGIGRADLALARPTWMPAALCEGLFLMLPDQEAVLASERGQWRYARGIVQGLKDFLRDRATR